VDCSSRQRVRIIGPAGSARDARSSWPFVCVVPTCHPAGNIVAVLLHSRMLLALDRYSSGCGPVRGCTIARGIGRTGVRRGVPKARRRAPVPGSPASAALLAVRGMIVFSAALRLRDPRERCTTVCRGRTARGGASRGDRELPGQTGLGRKPALDVGWVRQIGQKPVPVEHLLGNGGGPASARLDCLGGREGILKEVAAKIA
jgi:hypothetical protein